MYECNVNLSDAKPDRPVDVWTQESTEGKILFVVFYTQACRWKKCIGCNFHDNASRKHVNFEDIIDQIDHVFDNIDTTGVNKIIFSNGGSMLDEETFSSTALMYLVYKLNRFHKHVKIISLESRLEYIDKCELEMLKRALMEGNSETELEIGIGFEAYDPYIRNTVFNKGLDDKDFEKFLSVASEYGYSVKCYFMLKPIPNLSTEDAIADIHKAIGYLSHCSEKYDVKINMHLNPTYVAKNTQLVKPFNEGAFVPPTLIDVCKAILPAKDTGGDKFSIYLGLSDEGLAVEGGSFIRDEDIEAVYVEMLETYNRTQDYDIIEHIIGTDYFYKNLKKSLTID